MATIVQAFSALAIKIDDRIISGLTRLVIGFETRLPSHLVALNSQSLGVHRIAFIPSDMQALFHLCGVSEQRMKTVIHQVPAINPNYKVASDPFALLCIWLVHLAVLDITDVITRGGFQINVLKYLHYRFFTSLVNHHLPHGANEAVMTAVIRSLTRKSDIIVYGSWRKVIEARCFDVLSDDSIHLHTIATASPDAKVLYIITDIQSRIRDKLNLVCEVYYQFHKADISIGSRASTTTDVEGEQILVAKYSVFDAAISNVTIEILNLHKFVDQAAVRQVVSQFQAVSPAMLCAVLAEWSALATEQTQTHQLDYVEQTDSGPRYIGARALITEIIQVSFRHCMENRISLANKSAVWIELKNLYSSSRVTDKAIIAIKDSVGYFVESIGRTSRESTKASLRLALIMMIVYKSFKYMT